MVTQQDIGRADPSHGSQGLLVQHSHPYTLHSLIQWGSLGGEVRAWEYPGAVQLGVLVPFPGQPRMPDSIFLGMVAN